LEGRRERQVARWDGPGAADGAARSCSEGARERRGNGGVPGWWFDCPGATRKVAWAHGGRARGRRTRQADPQSALPAARALWSGWDRRIHETRDQSAADGWLAGLWRGFRDR